MKSSTLPTASLASQSASYDGLKPNSRVVLVDSSAVLFRSFDGYKQSRMGLWDDRSVDMAPLFGYLYYLQKLYKEFEFDDLIHVQDAPGGSFYRYQLYPAYKANREERPLLETPKAMLSHVLAAFGEKVIRKRGIEADDVIATLAVQLAEKGHMVMVVSNDKDLMQLADKEQITICRYVQDPQGQGKMHDVYGEEEVFEKLGIRPDQIADWLALMGDASDNIPGVPNVGEKKAQKLIQEFGDIPTIMTRVNDIKGALGENIKKVIDELPLYSKLTNLLKDVLLEYPQSPIMDEEKRQMIFKALSWKPEWPTSFEVGMEGFREDMGAFVKQPTPFTSNPNSSNFQFNTKEEKSPPSYSSTSPNSDPILPPPPLGRPKRI